MERTRAANLARSRLRRTGKPIAVGMLSEQPLDPPAGARDADCWRALLTDGQDDVEFVVCAGRVAEAPNLTIAQMVEEKLLREFGSDPAALLERVRRRASLEDVLYIGASAVV
jgi:hypothetical protein